MRGYKWTMNVLVVGISLLSLAACLAGLFSDGGQGAYTYQAVTGELVEIYGMGLYGNDSISVVAQGKAGDMVTLVMGIPLLLVALILTNKNSFRGKLLLAGTLGYFLYTYMSYAFFWHYNPFFIVYVMLMSLSLYAFIINFMSFDMKKIPELFSDRLPVKLLAGFQFFVGIVIGAMWLAKIAPSIFEAAVPVGLEHYTTLVIQAMDLGIIVPTAILSAVLLLKKRPMGYLLTSVIVVKGFTMLTALTAMIVNMWIKGVDVNPMEALPFLGFNIFAVVCFVVLMKNAPPGPS